MKKTTVKKIFIFFLIYLPLQYAAVGLIGMTYSEPWPAFVLPAFQSVDATPRVVAVTEPELSVVEASMATTNVLPRKLFTGIQESQLQGFMRTNFAGPRQWSGREAEAKKWLKNQIMLNYSSIQAPKSLEVRWIKRYYNFRDSERRVDSTEVLTKFRINLDNG